MGGYANSFYPMFSGVPKWFLQNYGPTEASRCALFRYYLFPINKNVTKAKKLSRVREVISWKLEKEVPDLSLWEIAYSHGVGSPGRPYLIRLPEVLGFFLQFARAFP